jgi:hypothetical protein
MGVLVPCSGQGHNERGWCQVAAMKSTLQKFWNVISKYSKDGLECAAMGSSATRHENDIVDVCDLKRTITNNGVIESILHMPLH